MKTQKTLLVLLSSSVWCSQVQGRVRGASKSSRHQSSKTADHRTSSKKHLIFSTDCSGGLYGPNGNYDECPANFQNDVNGPVDFRDIDDLMAITLALNSPDEAQVHSIIPTFGDASMRANFLTGTRLVHILKDRKDIPIIPGSSEASQPVFIDAFRIISDIDEAGWGGPLPSAQTQKPVAPPDGGLTIDPVSLFEMSCQNLGVMQMQDELDQAIRCGYQIDLLAIGPQTDIACLLLHASEEQLRAIRQIVSLIGQVLGVPNGASGVTARDFNMVSDPLAATIVLSFSEKVKMVLMQFQLTFQTSSTAPILFNNSTFREDTLPFFSQAKSQARPTEGPFDQYTVAYALHPEWFVCDNYPAVVVQCSQNDGDSVTSSTPPDVACTTSQGYSSSSYTAGVSAELSVDLNKSYKGPLVVGNQNGNILNYQESPAANVMACTDFAPGGLDAFREFVYKLN